MNYYEFLNDFLVAISPHSTCALSSCQDHGTCCSLMNCGTRLMFLFRLAPAESAAHRLYLSSRHASAFAPPRSQIARTVELGNRRVNVGTRPRQLYCSPCQPSVEQGSQHVHGHSSNMLTLCYPSVTAAIFDYMCCARRKRRMKRFSGFKEGASVLPSRSIARLARSFGRRARRVGEYRRPRLCELCSGHVVAASHPDGKWIVRYVTG
ncbi:hypothetical protein BD311DRAFT_771418 [Dichomitus squalens]|uniref:Uncharacterized protein n=1 Tax=Dichomitus squalens TaxID=114155 RepID=A0A4Q9M708_9APHY|nr:hypothetical protein BD311DRAFT_771418 [Dichomitus squalens]